MYRIYNWLAFGLPKYWKAAIAAVPVVVFVGTEVVQAIQEGSVDGSLTWADGFRIATVAVTAYMVYRKANAPAEPTPAG